MALNLHETLDSQSLNRSADSANISLKWIAFYSNSHSEVYTATRLVAPLVYEGYLRQKIACDPIAAGFWKCQADYGFSATSQQDSDDADDDPLPDPNDSDPIGPEVSVDFTAAQSHITQSLQTNYRMAPGDAFKYGTTITVDGLDKTKVTPTFSGGGIMSALDVGKFLLIPADPGNGFAVGTAFAVTAQDGTKYTLAGSPATFGKSTNQWSLVDSATKAGTATNPNNNTGPNYQRAIGVSTDRIEGTDIYYPHFEWTFTHQIRPFTGSYKRVIRSLAGKVNSATFYGDPPGSVLYLGATANCGPDAVFKVTHKFAVGENLVAVPVSPKIIIPSKLGWEYLWVVYAPSKDGNAIVQTPVAAMVEQVYRFGDFRTLGIGA